MEKNFENLIFGGLHEKHAVQRGIWVPTQHSLNSQLNYEYIGLSVPHRKHITSPLRAQQVNAIYRFVTMAINITITILDIIHRCIMKK
jgi:hypothetical protein